MLQMRRALSHMRRAIRATNRRQQQLHVAKWIARRRTEQLNDCKPGNSHINPVINRRFGNWLQTLHRAAAERRHCSWRTVLLTVAGSTRSRIHRLRVLVEYREGRTLDCLLTFRWLATAGHCRVWKLGNGGTDAAEALAARTGQRSPVRPPQVYVSTSTTLTDAHKQPNTTADPASNLHRNTGKLHQVQLVHFEVSTHVAGIAANTRRRTPSRGPHRETSLLALGAGEATAATTQLSSTPCPLLLGCSNVALHRKAAGALQYRYPGFECSMAETIALQISALAG